MALALKQVPRALSILVIFIGLGCRSTGIPPQLPKDETIAESDFQHYLAIAEQGNPEAQYSVANYYSRGLNGPQDDTNAFKWFAKSANLGYAKAQTALGIQYLHGKGTAADFDEGIKWLNKAVDRGETNAQALLYGLTSIGLPTGMTNPVSAGKMIREMANNGNPAAQCFVAASYAQGPGKNPVLAFNWYEKAALQGEADAQAYIGSAYFYGIGIRRNYTLAFQWSRLAGNRGKSGAQLTLGLCYLHGKGVRKDVGTAVKWLQKSASQGNDEAQLAMGVACRDGVGVPKDYVNAYKWTDLAAVQGNTRAVAVRAALRSRMNRQQLAQAGFSPGLNLTRFNRRIVDAHVQRYSMSCIPSAVEMVLKLNGVVPVSYYEQQDIWQNKADGSFHDYDGKTIGRLTFRQSFTGGRSPEIARQVCESVHKELKAGRYVIVGFPSGGDTHDWVIYDETEDGEFLAISKAGPRTIENNHGRQTILDMNGTDLGTYEFAK